MSFPIKEIEEAIMMGGVVKIDGHRLSVEVNEEGELEFSFKNARGSDCITFVISGDSLKIPNYYMVTE